MMERPCFSSSFARAKTASAPSPVNCETRDAICPMVEFRIVSFGEAVFIPLDRQDRCTAKRGAGGHGRTAPYAQAGRRCGGARKGSSAGVPRWRGFLRTGELG